MLNLLAAVLLLAGCEEFTPEPAEKPPVEQPDTPKQEPGGDTQKGDARNDGLLGRDDTYEEEKDGVRLTMQYDASEGAFTGTAENTTDTELAQVRVTVQLSDGTVLEATLGRLLPQSTQSVHLRAGDKKVGRWAPLVLLQRGTAPSPGTPTPPARTLVWVTADAPAEDSDGDRFARRKSMTFHRDRTAGELVIAFEGCYAGLHLPGNCLSHTATFEAGEATTAPPEGELHYVRETGGGQKGPIECPATLHPIDFTPLWTTDKCHVCTTQDCIDDLALPGLYEWSGWAGYPLMLVNESTVSRIELQNAGAGTGSYRVDATRSEVTVGFVDKPLTPRQQAINERPTGKPEMVRQVLENGQWTDASSQTVLAVGDRIRMIKGTLSDSDGTWLADNNIDSSLYRYWWTIRRDGTFVWHGADTHYVVVAADKGKKLQACVRYKDDTGQHEAEVCSSSTATIQ